MPWLKKPMLTAGRPTPLPCLFLEHETRFAVGHDATVLDAGCLTPEHNQPTLLSLDPTLQRQRLSNTYRVAITNLTSRRVGLATLPIQSICRHIIERGVEDAAVHGIFTAHMIL